MPDCIDLKQRYGHQYRTVPEQSFRAERGDTARAVDPWLMTIPCQHGHIFPFGGSVLAVATNTRGGISKRLAALNCCTLHQDGDDGCNLLFDARHFARVAKIVKPRKRRRLSPEHRAKLLAATEGHRFKPHNAVLDPILTVQNAMEGT